MATDTTCHCDLFDFLSPKSFQPSTVHPLSDSCMFIFLSETDLGCHCQEAKAKNSEAQWKSLTLLPLGSPLIPCDLAPPLFC